MQFKHVKFLYFKGIDHFEDIGPCVIMASPGMMQSGLSRELFESWCTDSKNGVIIAGTLGYCLIKTKYPIIAMLQVIVLKEHWQRQYCQSRKK